MSRRCTSWRFHDIPEHVGHLPGGKCRKCWTPCHARLTQEEWDAGQRRCDACVDALLQSSDPTVRRALVDEPNQDVAVLRVLVTDPNGPIALAAERALSVRSQDAGLAGDPRPAADGRGPSTMRSVW